MKGIRSIVPDFADPGQDSLAKRIAQDVDLGEMVDLPLKP